MKRQKAKKTAKSIVAIAIALWYVRCVDFELMLLRSARKRFEGGVCLKDAGRGRDNALVAGTGIAMRRAAMGAVVGFRNPSAANTGASCGGERRRQVLCDDDNRSGVSRFATGSLPDQTRARWWWQYRWLVGWSLRFFAYGLLVSSEVVGWLATNTG